MNPAAELQIMAGEGDRIAVEYVPQPWVRREVIGDAVLYLGDCRDILPTLSDASVEIAFTSPPYNLGEGMEDKGGLRVGHVGSRSIADPHRAFNIDFAGHVVPVVATTRSKARYSYWLDVRDCFPDMSFATFCKRVRVTSAFASGAPQ